MKMMKTDMEFVVFDAHDVIATSGEISVTIAGLQDSTAKNIVITMTGQTDPIYSWSKNSSSNASVASGAALIALNNAMGEDQTGITRANALTFVLEDNSEQSLSSFFSNEESSSLDLSAFNATFKWIAAEGYFKQ